MEPPVIMSSINEARAITYFIDALNDVTDASIMLRNERLHAALFHVQQSSEKATKACLSMVGIIGLKDHLIAVHVRNEILPASPGLEHEFRQFLDFLRRVQSYYITARYAVDTSGEIRFSQYSVEYVGQLLTTTQAYIQLCFRFVEEKTHKKLPRTIDDLTSYLKSHYSEFIR
jgi:HEPN domain-containing protein